MKSPSPNALIKLSLTLCLIHGLVGCAVAQKSAQTPGAKEKSAEQRFDRVQILKDVRDLSSDAFEGRKTGTPGSTKAAALILEAFKKHGLKHFNDSYAQKFSFTKKNVKYNGTNIVGYLEGTSNKDHYIAVTAHYDHEGVIKGEIYNGADDNASGVGAILALAEYFNKHKPLNSIIFAALDAEEFGFEGARAFVAHFPAATTSIALNINLDMLSRNDKSDLYMTGTYHYPYLKPYVEKLLPTARVKVLFGHDRPLSLEDDWTNSSDHAAFHKVHIPFLYIGVDEHKDYHKPTDDFANINQEFYIGVVETVLDVIQEMDKNLPAIVAARRS